MSTQNFFSIDCKLFVAWQSQEILVFDTSSDKLLYSEDFSLKNKLIQFVSLSRDNRFLHIIYEESKKTRIQKINLNNFFEQFPIIEPKEKIYSVVALDSYKIALITNYRRIYLYDEENLIEEIDFSRFDIFKKSKISFPEKSCYEPSEKILILIANENKIIMINLDNKTVNYIDNLSGEIISIHPSSQYLAIISKDKNKLYIDIKYYYSENCKNIEIFDHNDYYLNSLSANFLYERSRMYFSIALVKKNLLLKDNIDIMLISSIPMNKNSDYDPIITKSSFSHKKINEISSISLQNTFKSKKNYISCVLSFFNETNKNFEFANIKCLNQEPINKILTEDRFSIFDENFTISNKNQKFISDFFIEMEDKAHLETSISPQNSEKFLKKCFLKYLLINNYDDFILELIKIKVEKNGEICYFILFLEEIEKIIFEIYLNSEITFFNENILNNSFKETFELNSKIYKLYGSIIERKKKEANINKNNNNQQYFEEDLKLLNLFNENQLRIETTLLLYKTIHWLKENNIFLIYHENLKDLKDKWRIRKELFQKNFNKIELNDIIFINYFLGDIDYPCSLLELINFCVNKDKFAIKYIFSFIMTELKNKELDQNFKNFLPIYPDKEFEIMAFLCNYDFLIDKFEKDPKLTKEKIIDWSYGVSLNPDFPLKCKLFFLKNLKNFKCEQELFYLINTLQINWEDQYNSKVLIDIYLYYDKLFECYNFVSSLYNKINPLAFEEKFNYLIEGICKKSIIDQFLKLNFKDWEKNLIEIYFSRDEKHKIILVIFYILHGEAQKGFDIANSIHKFPEEIPDFKLYLSVLNEFLKKNPKLYEINQEEFKNIVQLNNLRIIETNIEENKKIRNSDRVFD